MWSFPFSFLSLSIASMKLFYSQRLGVFSDQDPSLKMFLITAPFNICILISSIYSLVMMATYGHEYVLVLMGAIVLANIIVLRLTYLTKPQLHEIINIFYNQQKEFGTKDSKNVFYTAMFTAWISPCAAWTNNFAQKSKFLFFSSFITIAVHCISFAFLFSIASSSRMIQTENPPISHCFHQYETETFSRQDYKLYFSGNATKWIVSICKNGEKCLPVIRICADNENPLEVISKFSIPVGLSLLLLSLCASACLQYLTSYHKLYLMSKRFHLKCPKFFYWFLLDFVINYKEIKDEVKRQNLFDRIQDDLSKNDSFKISAKRVLDDTIKHLQSCQEREVLLKFLQQVEIETEIDNKRKVWNDPPMHAVVDRNQFGLWCIMNLIGGEAGAQNGLSKSSINTINDKMKSHEPIFENSNFVTKWLTKRAAGRYGENALHNATQLGDKQLMKVLLANSYNVNEVDDNGQTPLFIALETENTLCMMLLLKHNATVNEKLLDVACEKKSPKYLKLLIENYRDVDLRDKFGKTMLHRAASEDKVKVLQLLIDKNCDINAKDFFGMTPLHSAVLNGSLESMKILISKKADINSKDNQGKTALHQSVLQNKFDCLKHLIDSGADLDSKDNSLKTALMYSIDVGKHEYLKLLVSKKAKVDEKDIYCKSAIHYAIEKNKLEDVACLVENGRCDVDSLDGHGLAPLHRAVQEKKLKCVNYLIDNNANVDLRDNKEMTPLHHSVMAGYFGCLEVLIGANADVNARDVEGMTPLHRAVFRGAILMLEHLIENNAEIDAKDNQGRTTLHHAVEKGELEIVSCLIYNKADVNAKNNEGLTPLHLAAFFGQLECLKNLLDHNSEIDAKDASGMTPLHSSVLRGQLKCLKHLTQNHSDLKAKDDRGRTALHFAAGFGQLDCLKHLMEVNGGKGGIKSYCGMSPIHFAAKYDKLECLQYLIENDANLNDRDASGKMPLHLAAMKGNLSCLKCLTEKRADLNSKDKEGKTALHYAVLLEKLDCLSCLLEHNAAASSKDQNGKTPLHCAVEVGHVTCVKGLLDSHADVNARDNEGNIPLHLLMNEQYAMNKKVVMNEEIAMKDKIVMNEKLLMNEEEEQIFEMLVQAGADLKALNYRDETPMEAIKNKKSRNFN